MSSAIGLPPASAAHAARLPLAVDSLSVSFGRGRHAVTAVSDVSFQIDPGEIVALVGESGSGKSTIAKTLLGILPSGATVTGSIRVDGVDVLALPPAQRRRLAGRTLAAIPQDPLGALDPLQRVGKQVGQVLRLHGDTAHVDERVADALERTGLEPASKFVRRWPHELSGGQRQRALIAAALIARPSIIVADEPTSALDVTVQRRVLDRLRQLVDEEGASMLLVTHDLGVAADRAERVLVLDGGRLVEQGRTGQVLATPRSPRARALVAALPRDDHPEPSPGEEGTPLLEVDGVSKRFGGLHGTQALDDVSLALQPGGALGVVGASGSGKSTLARIVLGLERPDTGTVTLADRLVAPIRGAADRRQRAQAVQPVFQDPSASLDPRMAVGRSVLEPLAALRIGNRRVRQWRVRELLDLVRLEASVARRRPHELSGGQLQRVAIARALAASPRLLLCDEPVSALDASVQAAVLNVLAEARRELGTAILLISHDLAVVRQLCHDVVVLDRGQVVERGRTNIVFTTPASEVAKDLVASIPGAESLAAA